ncbi:hypothetical protein TCSYLVIO_006360 [Trypanosoma cruzi]|nr:hypothetical protein TCSYLVIO_006360 [Trypanosoma cruzi]
MERKRSAERPEALSFPFFFLLPRTSIYLHLPTVCFPLPTMFLHRTHACQEKNSATSLRAKATTLTAYPAAISASPKAPTTATATTVKSTSSTAATKSASSTAAAKSTSSTTTATATAITTIITVPTTSPIPPPPPPPRLPPRPPRFPLPAGLFIPNISCIVSLCFSRATSFCIANGVAAAYKTPSAGFVFTTKSCLRCSRKFLRPSYFSAIASCTSGESCAWRLFTEMAPFCGMCLTIFLRMCESSRITIRVKSLSSPSPVLLITVRRAAPPLL